MMKIIKEDLENKNGYVIKTRKGYISSYDYNNYYNTYHDYEYMIKFSDSLEDATVFQTKEEASKIANSMAYIYKYGEGGPERKLITGSVVNLNKVLGDPKNEIKEKCLKFKSLMKNLETASNNHRSIGNKNFEENYDEIKQKFVNYANSINELFK